VTRNYYCTGVTPILFSQAETWQYKNQTICNDNRFSLNMPERKKDCAAFIIP